MSYIGSFLSRALGAERLGVKYRCHLNLCQSSLIRAGSVALGEEGQGASSPSGLAETRLSPFPRFDCPAAAHAILVLPRPVYLRFQAFDRSRAGPCGSLSLREEPAPHTSEPWNCLSLRPGAVIQAIDVMRHVKSANQIHAVHWVCSRSRSIYATVPDAAT